MIRLVAVTLAALYGILYVFGDEDRRPDDVARAEPFGFQLMAAAVSPFDPRPERIHISDVSDRQAIELALAAGEQVRAERRAAPELGVQIAAAPSPEESAAPRPDEQASYWYVTGSLVNLRGGPGTSNAVVGQVTFGAEAEVLGDADGWYQIRLADGSASGWIFGRFLDENRPG